MPTTLLLVFVFLFLLKEVAAAVHIREFMRKFLKEFPSLVKRSLISPNLAAPTLANLQSDRTRYHFN